LDIYIVRHGEAASSWGESADPGLSELGLAQAQTAASTLAALPGSGLQLLSSPLLRAQETAKASSEKLGLAVAIDDTFREVPSPVPQAQRQAWLQEFMQQQWQEQPDALRQWRDSILLRLLELPRPTVIFSHFLVINAVVGSIENSSKTLCCWPDNGAIVQLSLSNGQLELVSRGAQIQTRVN
jgi:broad specificity phosphatase PhoE